MDDRELREALQGAPANGIDAPPFDAVFAAAENRYRARRRRNRWAAGAAAAAAVAVVVVALTVTNRAEHVAPQYIEMAELLNSTTWSAPSDVLLPEYEFDIYEELPTLTPSTLSAEGALL